VKIDPDELRAFASRDWGAPERLARRARARAPLSEKIRIAVELWGAARQANPGWPDEATRRRDLEHHKLLHRLLHSAPHVGAR
jgi:hypothetical protein